MHKEKDPGHNYFEQAYRICKQTPQSAKEIMFYVNLSPSKKFLIFSDHETPPLLCYPHRSPGQRVIKTQNRTSS